MKNVVMLFVIVGALSAAAVIYFNKQQDDSLPPPFSPTKGVPSGDVSPPQAVNPRSLPEFVPKLPTRTYSKPIDIADAEVADHVAKLVMALQVPENNARLTTGEQVAALPATALPHLREALKREDLTWVTICALSKGIELIERREAGESLSKASLAVYPWVRATTVEAYKQIGLRDSRWDRDVIQALELWALALCNSSLITSSHWNSMRDLLRRAVEQGCEDALVRQALKASYSQMAEVPPGHLAQDDIEGHHTVARMIKDSPYPAIRKAWAFAKLARRRHELDSIAANLPRTRTPVRADTRRWLDRSLEWFTKAAAEPDLPESELISFVHYYLHGCGEAGDQRAEGYERVKELVASKFPDGGVIEEVYGQYLIDWAWDARGYGYADTVTDDGAHKYGDRLRKAATYIASARKRFPDRPAFPQMLLKVGLGLGDTPEVMSELLRAAMRLDPDSNNSLTWVANYVAPRYYGNKEMAIAFGRQAILAANWEARFGHYLLSPHLDQAAWRPKDELAPVHSPDYFKDPEVWSDFHVACENMLKWHPGDRLILARYAIAAHGAEKWDIAIKLFDQLGDDPDPRPFGTSKKYRVMKLQVQNAAIKIVNVDPALTADDEGLRRLMVTMRWHLDYFSPGAQIRRRGEWAFNANGKMSDGNQPNWKIENGELQTYSDDKKTHNRWKFNRETGRWANVTNAEPDNGKGAFIIPIGKK